jgi:2-oxoisovalerate ferredoxin oxidoreductase beta subunit
VCELLGTLDAPAYLERVALGDAKRDLAARKAIRAAIRNQVEGRGFSLVEVLSPCPTGWKLPPPEAAQYVLDRMTKTFPLGVVRGAKAGASAPERPRTGARLVVPEEKIPGILGLTGAEGEDRVASPSDWSSDIEPRFRNPRIKAAGFGGQGVLFLGSLIAEAGMLSGRAVSWLPSYGPEMRGGTAHCHVILSDAEVDSPLVTRASVLFAFNGPSLERFAKEVVEGGLIVYDSSLVTEPPSVAGVETLGIPATKIAESLGSARAANLAALGAYIGRTRVLPPWAVESSLSKHHLRPEQVALNMKALAAGMAFRN